MKCSFCGDEIERGTGEMYVRKTGQARYYCSARCFKFDVVYHRKPSLKNQKDREKRKQG